MNEAVKREVLTSIAPTHQWRGDGASTYRCGATVVHTRFKSRGPFSFNISRTTLTAVHELWICGSAADYYLIPREAIRAIHDHPDAYPDKRHPNLRVISVDTSRHRAVFARGGRTMNLEPFFRAVIDATEA